MPVILFIGAFVCLAWWLVVSAIINGRIPQGKYGDYAYRDKEPERFWGWVIYAAAIASALTAILIYVAFFCCP